MSVTFSSSYAKRKIVKKSLTRFIFDLKLPKTQQKDGFLQNCKSYAQNFSRRKKSWKTKRPNLQSKTIVKLLPINFYNPLKYRKYHTLAMAVFKLFFFPCVICNFSRSCKRNGEIDMCHSIQYTKHCIAPHPPPISKIRTKNFKK